MFVNPLIAKSHDQSPLAPAGKTEISAALVQPFALISFKAVKRKNRVLTGANSDLLKRRIIPNVGERSRYNVGYPVDAVRARFKAVIFDSAVGVAVLPRQISEPANVMRRSHVYREKMRQLQILVPTGVPKRGRVAINRVGRAVVFPGQFPDYPPRPLSSLRGAGRRRFLKPRCPACRSASHRRLSRCRSTAADRRLINRRAGSGPVPSTV